MIDINIKEEDLYKKIVELLSEYFPTKAFNKVNKKGINPYYEISITNDESLKMVFFDEALGLNDSLLLKKGEWEKSEIKGLFYSVLKSKLYPLPWGSLVAVRPTSPLKNKGFTKKENEDYLKNTFGVSPFRAKLASEVFMLEEEALASSKEKIGLYLNIPFCPSKCTYCSFPSLVTKASKAYYEAYLKTLIDELKETHSLCKNKVVREIYIGGGTPASLEAKEFAQIFETLGKYYNLASSAECTVELGRVDSITKAQLEVLAKYSVNQISINCQSLNNNSLKLIKRNHTREDFLKTYFMAREGYDFSINVDLILGLPNESFEAYAYSLDEVLELDSDFLTLHTLCAKKGANLELTSDRGIFSRVEKMWEESYRKLFQKGYTPYYLYRQKRMVAPFENLGFRKEDKLNRYNLLMLSSAYTVLGFGMGATTKLSQNGICKTIINYRNMKSYLKDYKKTILEKRQVLEGSIDVN